MTLSDVELLELLAQGESDRVEFKESLSGDASKKIREAICAFANDLPDHKAVGVVFVGVRDNGVPTGLEASDKLLRQLADMRTDGNIVPPPSITVRKISVPHEGQNKDVAVITTLPSDSTPVSYRGEIHIRTGPRRDRATAQDERILNEKRRRRDAPYDVQPVLSATLNDLDQRYFESEYLPQAVPREVLEANERSLEGRLAAMKMIASVDDDDPKPTVLGLLVLGNNPQDFLPGAYIQFLRIDSKELDSTKITDNEKIDGRIADILRRLDEKLKAHNHTAIDFLFRSTEQRTSLYPFDALVQITRNAVMHRTYEATNAPVHVYWYSDRIEVMSPGGPFGQVTVDNLETSKVVDYRNPNLAEALRTLGFVQRFGVGIRTAQRLLREAGHREATFKATQNHILVTMHGSGRNLDARRKISKLTSTLKRWRMTRR